MDLIDLAGTAVIVTGASSGIGAATARLPHAAGTHPVLDPHGRIDGLVNNAGVSLHMPLACWTSMSSPGCWT